MKNQRLTILQNHLFPFPSEAEEQRKLQQHLLLSPQSTSSSATTTTTTHANTAASLSNSSTSGSAMIEEDFLSIEIVGMGRFVPPFVIPSETIDKMCDKPIGFTEKTCGVRNRRWVQCAEHLAVRRPSCISQSFIQSIEQGNKTEFNDEKVIDVVEMALIASREAIEECGIEAHVLSMILWASGTPERAIPDSSTLLHCALGLSDTGIPSTSVHSTCLSFLQAFHIAAQMLPNLDRRLARRREAKSGSKQRRKPYILIASSEAASCGLNFTGNPHSAGLMGDCAAAVVVTLPDDYYNKDAENVYEAKTGVHRWLFETYSGGAELTTIRGGGSKRHPSFRTTRDADNFFYMNGKQVLQFTAEKAYSFLERLRPGLTVGKVDDLAAIIPHQASRAGMELMSQAFNWPDDKVIKTLYELGNCISVSLPSTLYEAVKVEKRVNRGDKVLLMGTGAGLSIAGVIIRY